MHVTFLALKDVPVVSTLQMRLCKPKDTFAGFEPQVTPSKVIFAVGWISKYIIKVVEIIGPWLQRDS